MIIVTGGSGKARQACITELLAHNYKVGSVDLIRPPDVPVPFSRVELTDFGQTIEAFSQIDDRIRNVTAIVHLAAIPAPGLATNSVTFATNRSVLTTCSKRRGSSALKNVVWASSETVLGIPFDTPPPYVPIDEEYPGRPESAYSLSKLVGEEMAKQFCRWDRS